MVVSPGSCNQYTRIVINANSSPDYREKLNDDLNKIKDQEIWQAYRVMRNFRPGLKNEDQFLL